jgi:hypothetical protein
MKLLIGFWTLVLVGLQAGAIVLEPSACVVKKTDVCLVKTQGKPELVHWGSTFIWIAKDSMFELKGLAVRPLQGGGWIQSAEEIPFSTSYIQGTISGGIWISHIQGKTMIRHLSGDLFIRHVSSSEPMVLPVGFENWYAGLQTDGKPFQGIVRPLAANSFLVEWFKEFQVPAKVAKKFWITWSRAWKGNIDIGSEIYKTSMERQLASEKEKESARELRAERQRQEAHRLRQIYRSKNSIDAFRDPSLGPDSQSF